MTYRKPRVAKSFTVEEANACLPLVRAIVSDMIALSRDLLERRRRLDHLTAGRDLGSDLYSAELAQIEDEMSKENERLNGYLDEILQLGAEPKDPREGLVDFPAVLDGRDVYLCWKFGEPEVLYYHDRDAGFEGRQPLVAESASGDSLSGRNKLLGP